MTFADKLRELRANAGLSQKELADKVGVSQAAIVYWENGAKIPAFNSVQTICKTLGVPCAAFDDVEYKVRGVEMEGSGVMKVPDKQTIELGGIKDVPKKKSRKKTE